MIEVRIPVSDEDYKMLLEKAKASHLSPEEFGSLKLHNAIIKDDVDFEKIVDYITQKNAALYEKLA